MSDVHVSTDDDRFLFVQIADICSEVIFPLHAVIKAYQFILRIWSINGNQIEVLIFQRDYTAFMVMLIDAKTIGYRQRFPFCKDGNAGISFFLGTVPVLKIARCFKGCLIRLHFSFSKAEKISIFGCKEVKKAFSSAGTQTVDIPGN